MFFIKKQNFWFIIKIIAFIIFCFFLRAKVYTLGYVPSGSMEPTLQKGDYLFATKYDCNNIHRNDVILFDFPDDERVCYVKRVIGLPGEMVEIKEGHIYINGNLLKETFGETTEEGVYHVPQNSYFMLGDNRNNSHDSRFWEHPYVSKEHINGKVKCIILPFSRIRKL